MPNTLVINTKNAYHHPPDLVGLSVHELSHLKEEKLPIVDSFCITSDAFRAFIQHQQLDHTLAKLTQEPNPDKLKKAQQAIINHPFSPQLAKEIATHYHNSVHNQPVSLVLSPPTDAYPLSLADQHIKGDANLHHHLKLLWSKLFTTALTGSEKHHPLHQPPAFLVHVHPAAALSGRLITKDERFPTKNMFTVELSLGEFAPGFKLTNPHIYHLNSDDESTHYHQPGHQTTAYHLNRYGDLEKQDLKNPDKNPLTKDQKQALARFAKTAKQSLFYPQQLFFVITQFGDIKLLWHKPATHLTDNLSHNQEVIAARPAAPGMATGPIRFLKNDRDIQKINQGDIIVTPKASLELIPALKKAGGVICLSGSTASHLSILSRELQRPCVIHHQTDSHQLKNEEVVTINGTTGEITRGEPLTPPAKLKPTPHEPLTPATKLFINTAQKPLPKDAAGVGPIHGHELIQQLGTHPQATNSDTFNRHLKQALNQALPTTQLPIVYQLSDYSAQWLHSLKDSHLHEPQQANPKLGHRGLKRHLKDTSLIDRELSIISHFLKGHQNDWYLATPLTRSPEELLELKRHLALHKLYRPNNVKLMLTVSLPEVVINLAEYLSNGVDGLLIDLDHLHETTLGIDHEDPELYDHYQHNLGSLTQQITTLGQATSNHNLLTLAYGKLLNQTQVIQSCIQAGIKALSVPEKRYDHLKLFVHSLEHHLIEKHTRNQQSPQPAHEHT